jgi:hypothetical protein
MNPTSIGKDKLMAISRKVNLTEIPRCRNMYIISKSGKRIKGLGRKHHLIE